MSTEIPALTPMPVAWLVTHWRPGSHDWAWAEEYGDLIDRPETAAIERRVLDEGVGFMDYAAPILLGNDGRVWDGHHRIVLAMKHGISSVMVEGSVETAPAPAPSVVPEAAVEAVAPALYEHMRRTTPDGDRYPEWDAESRQAKAWLDYARAALTAALPLLTATPSATREATEDEVTEVVTEALTDAYRAERGMSRHTGLTAHDEFVIRNQAAHVVSLADARFNITPKEDR